LRRAHYRNFFRAGTAGWPAALPELLGACIEHPVPGAAVFPGATGRCLTISTRFPGESERWQVGRLSGAVPKHARFWFLYTTRGSRLFRANLAAPEVASAAPKRTCGQKRGGWAMADGDRPRPFPIEFGAGSCARWSDLLGGPCPAAYVGWTSLQHLTASLRHSQAAIRPACARASCCELRPCRTARTSLLGGSAGSVSTRQSSLGNIRAPPSQGSCWPSSPDPCSGTR